MMSYEQMNRVKCNAIENDVIKVSEQTNNGIIGHIDSILSYSTPFFFFFHMWKMEKPTEKNGMENKNQIKRIQGQNKKLDIVVCCIAVVCRYYINLKLQNKKENKTEN